MPRLLSLASGSLSALVVALVAAAHLARLPTFPPVPGLEAPAGLDKVAHFGGFLVSSWVWQAWARRRGFRAPGLATFAFATAYSAALELAQGALTTTRAADAMDLAASALGAAVGVALVRWRRLGFRE